MRTTSRTSTYTSSKSGGSFELPAKKKRRGPILQCDFYRSRFPQIELKVLEECITRSSESYAEQKAFLSKEEAQEICDYFFSVFEVPLNDYSLLEEKLKEMYDQGVVWNTTETIFDLILSLKAYGNQPFYVRELSDYSQEQITNLLSAKQIVMLEDNWQLVDLQKQGYVNKKQIPLLVKQTLQNFGYPVVAPDYSVDTPSFVQDVDPRIKAARMITRKMEQWIESRKYLVFFIEFSSIFAHLVEKYPTKSFVKRSNKDACACTIF